MVRRTGHGRDLDDRRAHDVADVCAELRWVGRHDIGTSHRPGGDVDSACHAARTAGHHFDREPRIDYLGQHVDTDLVSDERQRLRCLWCVVRSQGHEWVAERRPVDREFDLCARLQRDRRFQLGNSNGDRPAARIGTDTVFCGIATQRFQWRQLYADVE